MDSKSLATTAHKLLKEMGHEMPLGHVYELFSKLAGHKSWNVAKTKGGFPLVMNFALSLATSIGNGNYEVKVTAEVSEGIRNIELKKYYRVNATSALEANTIVSKYIDYRNEDDEALLTYPGVRGLAESENEEEFRNKNWELIYFNADIKVQSESTTSFGNIDRNIRIGSLTEEDITDILLIAGDVIREHNGSPQEIQKFHTTFNALGQNRVITTGGRTALSSGELTAVLDTIGGYYSSVNTGMRIGVISNREIVVISERLLNAGLLAKNEAEKQGYTYPGSTPENVIKLRKTFQVRSEMI